MWHVGKHKSGKDHDGAQGRKLSIHVHKTTVVLAVAAHRHLFACVLVKVVAVFSGRDYPFTAQMNTNIINYIL